MGAAADYAEEKALERAHLSRADVGIRCFPREPECYIPVATGGLGTDVQCDLGGLGYQTLRDRNM
jgi:hypothetical protein